MSLEAPRQNVVYRLARTHRESSYENRLAALRLAAAAVEGRGHVINPLLFFGTIRENQLEGAPRSNRRTFTVLCGLVLATGKRHGKNGEQALCRKNGGGRPNRTLSRQSLR